MKTTTIINDFHGSSAKVRINEHGETLLRRPTVNRVRRALCGIKDCQCGGALGQRGCRGFDIFGMADGEVMIREIVQ